MRETVVYEDATGQGKHLRLVLQTAKGGGEDQSVVVALKIRAIFIDLVLRSLLAETSAGDEAGPVHQMGRRHDIGRIGQIDNQMAGRKAGANRMCKCNLKNGHLPVF